MDFNQLSEVESSDLEKHFLMQYIKDVIWSSMCDKIPEPDEFRMEFYKACWDIIKVNLFECVNEFVSHGYLPRAITTSFITLILKNHNLQELNDYTFCLIGSVYRIISKLLVGRLKGVVGKLISKSQLTFIYNRNTLNRLLVVSKLVNFSRSFKKDIFLFKVDFEKAFDSVSWEYFLYVIKHMNFGSKWISWINACVGTNSISTLINGSPTVHFQVERGLR